MNEVNRAAIWFEKRVEAFPTKKDAQEILASLA